MSSSAEMNLKYLTISVIASWLAIAGIIWLLVNYPIFVGLAVSAVLIRLWSFR